jgi:hypothetical protein
VIFVRVCALVLFGLIVSLEGVEVWRAIARHTDHPLITSEHVWMLVIALVSLSFTSRVLSDQLLNLVRAARGKSTGQTDEHRGPKPRRRKL